MSDDSYTDFTSADHIEEGQRLLGRALGKSVTPEGQALLIAEAHAHFAAAQAINGLPALEARSYDVLSAGVEKG
ncbi:hypothetical protein ACH4S8_37870 [Streptomyces sp. NPDC021080]|uniref:hypothetical protein n=1 Tax=Streptomyces sp. NPDC021080 TaxID=3365110 RepID=UPI0037A6CD3A